MAGPNSRSKREFKRLSSKMASLSKTFLRLLQKVLMTRKRHSVRLFIRGMHWIFPIKIIRPGSRRTRLLRKTYWMSVAFSKIHKLLLEAPILLVVGVLDRLSKKRA
jgi:hypothetical protein